MSEQYELVVVYSDQLKDEEAERLTATIEKQITDSGGEITEKDVWGKKQLAYKINKRSYGYYVVLNFTAPQPLIAELNRQFKINDSVIRNSIVKKDKFAPDFISAPAFGDKDDKDDKEKSEKDKKEENRADSSPSKEAASKDAATTETAPVEKKKDETQESSV